jgi:hypothetical protein
LALASNFVLRVSWVFSISPTYWNSPIPSDYFKSIIFALEIVRRQQWNFYRLENEHLTNCEHNRVVNIVPLPLSLSDVDVQLHTGPEAAMLIRKTTDRESTQSREEAMEEEKLPALVPPSPAEAPQASAAAPVVGKGEMETPPTRSRRGSLFSYRRSSPASREDSSPDSSPERGTPTRSSPLPHSTPSSPSHPHALLVAATAVAFASAGVAGLEEAMRAAVKARESVGVSGRSSDLREAFDREKSRYGAAGTEPRKRSSRGVERRSPTSSGLSSNGSRRDEADEERKEGERGSANGSPAPSRLRPTELVPSSLSPRTRAAALPPSAPLLSDFDPAHVPTWLAGGPTVDSPSVSRSTSAAPASPRPEKQAEVGRGSMWPLRSRKGSGSGSGRNPPASDDADIGAAAGNAKASDTT